MLLRCLGSMVVITTATVGMRGFPGYHRNSGVVVPYARLNEVLSLIASRASQAVPSEKSAALTSPLSTVGNTDSGRAACEARESGVSGSDYPAPKMGGTSCASQVDEAMARLWLVDLSRPNEPFAKQLCRSTTQRPVEHELELRSEQGCVLVRGGDPWEAINNARALVRKFAGVEASHDIAAAVARVTEGL